MRHTQIHQLGARAIGAVIAHVLPSNKCVYVLCASFALPACLLVHLQCSHTSLFFIGVINLDTNLLEMTFFVVSVQAHALNLSLF